MRVKSPKRFVGAGEELYCDTLHKKNQCVTEIKDFLLDALLDVLLDVSKRKNTQPDLGNLTNDKGRYHT
jgi:hypothetical protein